MGDGLRQSVHRDTVACQTPVILAESDQAGEIHNMGFGVWVWSIWLFLMRRWEGFFEEVTVKEQKEVRGRTL